MPVPGPVRLFGQVVHGGDQKFEPGGDLFSALGQAFEASPCLAGGGLGAAERVVHAVDLGRQRRDRSADTLFEVGEMPKPARQDDTVERGADRARAQENVGNQVQSVLLVQHEFHDEDVAHVAFARDGLDTPKHLRPHPDQTGGIVEFSRVHRP